MHNSIFRFLLLTAVATVAAPSPAGAVVVADPGWVVGAVPLPGVLAADVAIAGTSILVGQGPFGAGTQSIVRRDADGTTTTIVSNLNALGGLAYDAARGIVCSSRTTAATSAARRTVIPSTRSRAR